MTNKHLSDAAPTGAPVDLCPSFHRYAGCACVLPRGHEGHCRSAWEGRYESPTACVWTSKDGAFMRHVEYVQGRRRMGDG